MLPVSVRGLPQTIRARLFAVNLQSSTESTETALVSPRRSTVLFVFLCRDESLHQLELGLHPDGETKNTKLLSIYTQSSLT